jgi:hypothetical protein
MTQMRVWAGHPIPFYAAVLPWSEQEPTGPGEDRHCDHIEESILQMGNARHELATMATYKIRARKVFAHKSGLSVQKGPDLGALKTRNRTL